MLDLDDCVSDKALQTGIYWDAASGNLGKNKFVTI